MYTREEIKEIINETVKIARDYPFLGIVEATKAAEEIFEKRKEPTADQSK